MPSKAFDPIEKMNNCVELLKCINTDYYTILFRVIMYLGYYAANKVGKTAFNKSVYLECYRSVANDIIILTMFEYRNDFCHAGDMSALYDKMMLIVNELPVFDDMDNEVKKAVYLLQNRDRVM